MLEEVESLAVNYFELNGFLVRRGFSAGLGTAGTAFPSLIVRNLKEEELEETFTFGFQWFSSDILKTRRAVVAIVGADLFDLGNRAIKQDKRLFQALKKRVDSKQAFEFPWDSIEAQGELNGHRKLVLLPVLPKTEPYRNDFCDILSKKGADGVITFRTLLDNMIQQLDHLEDSQLSSHMRMLRVLKQMDLLKIPQMDLFTS